MKLTILFATILIAIRIWMGFNVEPDDFHWAQAYKDIAHLFMGGLFVSWWNNRKRWKWYTFWILNIVEVATAILSRI